MNYYPKDILAWLKEKIHPTVESQMSKLDEEMTELKEAVESGNVEEIRKELIDVIIVAHGLAAIFEQPVQKGINDKMRINENRVWSVNEKGVPHHV